MSRVGGTETLLCCVGITSNRTKIRHSSDPQALLLDTKPPYRTAFNDYTKPLILTRGQRVFMSTSKATTDPHQKQQLILEYLREKVGDQMYFKSHLIAEDLGLNSKEVGANLHQIRNRDIGLTVEVWGYSSGTTWMVTADADSC